MLCRGKRKAERRRIQSAGGVFSIVEEIQGSSPAMKDRCPRRRARASDTSPSFPSNKSPPCGILIHRADVISIFYLAPIKLYLIDEKREKLLCHSLLRLPSIFISAIFRLYFQFLLTRLHICKREKNYIFLFSVHVKLEDYFKFIVHARPGLNVPTGHVPLLDTLHVSRETAAK